MSKVDWSKAPEGATHWMPDSRYRQEGFWKREGEANYFFEGGKWAFSGAKPFGHPALVKRPATPQWNGEGLPPVGCECLAFYMGQPQGVVNVRYSGECMILWSEDRQSEQCGAAEHYLFRPIRTPEQLAAEARERAINEMRHIAEHDAHSRAVDYGALYDAGYRRPEQ